MPAKLALEIDGGVFLPGGGRHNRGAGYRKDQEKFAEATIAGWHVLRVLPEDIKKGAAITWVERFFIARGLRSSRVHAFTPTMNPGVPTP